MAGRTSGTGGSPRPRASRPTARTAAPQARSGGARPAKRPAAGRAAAPAAPAARRDASPAAPDARREPSPRRPSRSSSPSARGRAGGSAYNAPSLWTKDAPAAPSGGPVRRALEGFGRALAGALSFLGRLAVRGLSALASLVRRSRAALAVLVVAALLAVGGLADAGVNAGKAYAGVHIGEIDVSGKTADEMRALVGQVYGERLEKGSVTVYASEEAVAEAADETARTEDAALAEQRSVEEERARRQSWTADAASLAAELPVDDLVADALAVGRAEGGLGARAAALFGGWTVEARADYGAAELEALAADVDAAAGETRVDFGITVADGAASVTEGHDGRMVDRAELARELDRALLESVDGSGSFVARVEYAPLRIDRERAQAACDVVNDAVAAGARFSYPGATWEATAADLGDWTATRIEERDGSWALVPYVDEARAKPAILAHVQEAKTGDPLHVTFERTDGGVLVHADGDGEVPLAAETVRALDAALYGAAVRAATDPASASAALAEGFGNASAARPGPGLPVEVAVASGAAPATSTFDEALALGLVSEIASYTTEYTSGPGTENRNHNIRLAADLLNDSIAPAGGTWSFNGTAGECNAERGFLGAGAIIDGEYDDAVGGGICQVATTVFNAVYDAGYPVPTRHNHSLYIGSYPAGRDAAVSWPDLDLVWKNDAASDVLLRTGYTDGSVTVTLYGVDPGYRVSTDVGEWAEGEKHKTKTERDETMAPGTSYVKTAGTDGKSITVIRTVTSSSGSVLHEDPFQSTYDPVTEVVVAGPETQEKKDGADAGDGAADGKTEER